MKDGAIMLRTFTSGVNWDRVLQGFTRKKLNGGFYCIVFF